MKYQYKRLLHTRPRVRYLGEGRIGRDVAPFPGDQGGNAAHTGNGGLRGAEAEMDAPGEGHQGDPWEGAGVTPGKGAGVTPGEGGHGDPRGGAPG